MSNYNKKLLGLIGVCLITSLVLFYLKPECLFLKVTNIRCPACGITRAIREIFSFNILESFSYNILAFPIFLVGVIAILIGIYDMIRKSNFESKYVNFFLNNYKFIIFFLVLSMIVNNIRGI